MPDLKYSYIARQPILNSEQNTVGYELLFRDGPNNTFPDIDPELATQRLLSEHFLATHYSTIGDKLAFVNFPYQSLVNLIPTLFPKDNLVIEILETCEPTQELLHAVRKMHTAGYTIALDDFIPKKAWLPFLAYTSIIKIDIRLYPLDKAKKLIQRLAAYDIEFLAEKVETHQEFELAKQMGFNKFQGYFFSKPQLIRRKQIKPSFITVIQLVKEIAKTELDYDELERLISIDVTLSYKLLSFVNSSYLIRSEITSFKQAFIYLGEDRLRKFISLAAITSTQDDKPDMLYNLSIQRARFCQLLIKDIASDIDDGLGFLTGMFSLLDSLFDQPLVELVENMPINNLVKVALVANKGKLGKVLSLVKAYESAEWDLVAELCQKLQLDDEALTKHYDSSIKWTEELLTIEPDQGNKAEPL